MAHIVVIGAGLGGLPTAYELRHLLPHHHRITLISDTPQFTFLPSLPWVALGLTALESIQVKLIDRLEPRGIHWVQGRVEGIDPDNRQLVVNQDQLSYDYLAIATGAELDLDALPGLGPDDGYTQSVCNPHPALLARQAWQQFLEQPGSLVVGAVLGASCFGPAYEFALLADRELRKRGLRDRVPITFVTPEPYAGHLGIGGMANSAKLVTSLMAARGVEVIENAAVMAVESDRIRLADGRLLPFAYAMLLPAFRGPQFLQDVPGLADANGFIPVTNLKRLEQMAERFRVMSDPTRLQILAVLGEQELSVQDICDRTGFKQSNVSKHLRVLREIGAIACEQRSYYHYYRAIDPQILSCWRCTKTACNESGEPHVKAKTGTDAELPSACDRPCSQTVCHHQF